MRSVLRRCNAILTAKGGFTLLEVVLSLMLFSLFAVAILQSFDAGVRMTYQSVDLTGAASDSASQLYSGEGQNVTSQIEYEVGWFNINNDGDGNGQLYAVEGTTNDGSRVVYYYYRPYHPFACGAQYGKCPACSYTSVKPTAIVNYGFYKATGERIEAPAKSSTHDLKMLVTDGLNVLDGDFVDCTETPVYSERVDVGKTLVFSVTSLQFFDNYVVSVNGMEYNTLRTDWSVEVPETGLDIRFIEKISVQPVTEERFSVRIGFYQNATVKDKKLSGGTPIEPAAIAENNTTRYDELSGMTVFIAGQLSSTIRSLYSEQKAGRDVTIPAGVTLSLVLDDKYIFDEYDVYINGQPQQTARLSWNFTVPSNASELNNNQKRLNFYFIKKNVPTATITLDTDIYGVDFSTLYGLKVREVTSAGFEKQNAGITSNMSALFFEVGNHLELTVSDTAFYDHYSIAVGGEEIKGLTQWSTAVTVGAIRITIVELSDVTCVFQNPSGIVEAPMAIAENGIDPLSGAKLYYMGKGVSVRDVQELRAVVGRGVSITFGDNVVFYYYELIVVSQGVSTPVYNASTYTMVVRDDVQFVFRRKAADKTITVGYRDKANNVMDAPAINGNVDPLYRLTLNVTVDEKVIETYLIRDNPVISLRSGYAVKLTVSNVAIFNVYNVLLDDAAIPRSNTEFAYTAEFSTLTIKEVTDPEAVVDLRYVDAEGNAMTVGDVGTLGNLTVRVMYVGNELVSHVADGNGATLNGYVSATLRITLTRAFYDKYELVYSGNALTTGKTSFDLAISSQAATLIVRQKPVSRITIGYYDYSGIATVPANTYGLRFSVGESDTVTYVDPRGMTVSYEVGTTLRFAVDNSSAFSAYRPFANGTQLSRYGATFSVTIDSAVTSIEMRAQNNIAGCQFTVMTYDADGLETEFTLTELQALHIGFARGEVTYDSIYVTGNYNCSVAVGDTVTISVPHAFYSSYTLTVDGVSVAKDEDAEYSTQYSTVVREGAVAFNVELYLSPEAQGAISRVSWGFYSLTQQGFEPTNIITVNVVADPLFGLTLSVDDVEPYYSVRETNTLTAKIGDKLYFTATANTIFAYYSIYLYDGENETIYRADEQPSNKKFYYQLTSSQVEIYFVAVNGGAVSTVTWSTINSTSGVSYGLSNIEEDMINNMVSLRIGGVDIDLASGSGSKVVGLNSRVEFSCNDVIWFDSFNITIGSHRLGKYDDVYYSTVVESDSLTIVLVKKSDISFTFAFVDGEGNPMGSIPELEYQKIVDMMGNQTEEYLIVDEHNVVSKDPLQGMTIEITRNGYQVSDYNIRDNYNTFSHTSAALTTRMDDVLTIRTTAVSDYDIYINGDCISTTPATVYRYVVPEGVVAINLVLRAKVVEDERVTVTWAFFSATNAQTLIGDDLDEWDVVLYDINYNEISRWAAGQYSSFSSDVNCYVGFSSIGFLQKYQLYASVNHGEKLRVRLSETASGRSTVYFPLNMLGTVHFSFCEIPPSDKVILDISLYSEHSANDTLEVVQDSVEYNRIKTALTTYSLGGSVKYYTKIIIPGIDSEWGSANIASRKNLVDFLDANPYGYSYEIGQTVTIEGDGEQKITDITDNGYFDVYCNGQLLSASAPGVFTIEYDNHSKELFVDIVYKG